MVQQICGVDADIVEGFLELIVQEDQRTSAAEYFLQSTFGKSALSPRRDVVGRLIDIIVRRNSYNRSDLSRFLDDAKEDVGKNIANDYLAVIVTAHEDISERLESSQTARAHETKITVLLSEIDQLIRHGRLGLGKPFGTSDWEDCMKALLLATRKLGALKTLVDDYEKDDTQTKQFRWGIALALLALAITIGVIVFDWWGGG